MQAEAAQAELESENLRALLPQLSDLAAQGVLGPVSDAFEGYLPGLGDDPRITTMDAARLGAVEADTLNTRAQAGLRTGQAGYLPQDPDGYFGEDVGAGMIPADESERIRANAYATDYAQAALQNAAARMRAAERPIVLSSTTETEGTFIQNPDGSYSQSPGTSSRTEELADIDSVGNRNLQGSGTPAGEQRLPAPRPGLTPLGYVNRGGQLYARYRNAQNQEVLVPVQRPGQ
jgi:hypothetical protein